ncbi:MAG: FixH family protein [Rhodothermales bacterium]|nr:FixH family protein [Rhodothermales bacterium]
MKAFSSSATRLSVLGAILLASACSPDITETDFYSRHPDDAPSVEEGPVVVGEQTVDGITVSLLRTEVLHAGYNDLMVRLEESNGAAISNARIAIAAIASRASIDYEPLSFGSPVVGSSDGTADVGVLLLQTAESDVDWTLNVAATFGNRSVSVPFDIEVSDSLWVQRVETSASNELLIAWVQPVRPQTGDTSLEFAVYRDTGVSFEAVTNAEIDLYPYMDMGGGDGHSTPYTIPEQVEPGRYRGRINFIMAGGWDLTLFVNLADEPANEIVFQGFRVQ